MTTTADELGELETDIHGRKVETLLAMAPVLIAALGWWKARRSLKAARHELAELELHALVIVDADKAEDPAEEEPPKRIEGG